MPSKSSKKKDEISKEKNSEKKIISKKRVVFIEIDQEVTDVYKKIKNIKGKTVYIVAPKRSLIFQSVVNLKILKRKAGDDDKKIKLITNDENGIHLAQKIGIEVYNKANTEGRTAIFSPELEDDRLKITPLKATVNSVEEEIPTRLEEKKLSISELLKNYKKRKCDLNILKIRKPKLKPKKPISSPKFTLVTPNKHALFGLVAGSLIILLIIIYIALPGVKIHITPSASVLEETVNITLADYNKNRSILETNPKYMIASFPIKTTVKKEINYFATGQKVSDNAADASGIITIINTTNNAWPLIANTRFQTEEGIVFRIKDSVTVPPSTAEENGTIEIFVTADTLDAHEQMVGEKGNIEPAKFFLPGLREESQKLLYAESKEPMTGGVTDFVTYVSKEDVSSAKTKIKQDLKKIAIDELRAEVKKQAALAGNNKDFELLEGSNTITIGEPRVSVDENIVNTSLEEFEVIGEVDVSGFYYDKDDMLAILTRELMLKKSPHKILVRINDDTITYRIFEKDDARGQIKITANIKGIEQYEIDPKKQQGQKLLQQITDNIVGRDIESAISYMQNLPQINTVTIERWPAWAPTVPNVSDNIKYEIRDAVE